MTIQPDESETKANAVTLLCREELDAWLIDALRNCSPSTRAPLTNEVKAHYEAKISQSLEAGATLKIAHSAAMTELGNPRQFRRRILTQRQENWLDYYMHPSKINRAVPITLAVGFAMAAAYTLILSPMSSSSRYDLLTATFFAGSFMWLSQFSLAHRYGIGIQYAVSLTASTLFYLLFWWFLVTETSLATSSQTILFVVFVLLSTLQNLPLLLILFKLRHARNSFLMRGPNSD